MSQYHTRLLATLFTIGLGTTSIAFGDDAVTEQIDRARQAYEAGDLQQAKQDLQQATNTIDARLSAQRLTLLPEALPGWRALQAESTEPGIAAMLTGTTLSRIYTREADGAQITLSLTLDSPLAPMLAMAITSPLLLQANPEMTLYQFEHHQGTLEHTAGTQDYEVTLLVENRLVIRASGTALEDDAPLRDYLQALDIEKVTASLTR